MQGLCHVKLEAALRIWMEILNEPLLSTHEAQEIVSTLQAEADSSWQPGSDTAGYAARTVKNNRQLLKSTKLYQKLAPELGGRLFNCPIFKAMAFPKSIHSLLLSRAGVGEGYGRHVDNAFMGASRADLSFTLFLSEPSAYEGGALVMETPKGQEAFRLSAGHVLVYPSTYIH